MKRFAWSLILLVLCGAAVFFIGWIQLRVEPGSWAVLVTKTGGVDGRALEPGRFHWTAAALLPTNVRLYGFKGARAERTVSLQGELPSAAAYRLFMAGEPDFSWQISLKLAAAVDPSSLPVLVERDGVKDDASLSAWLSSALDALAGSLRSAVLSLAADAAGARALADGSAAASIEAMARTANPALADVKVSVVAARVPDMDLYESARDMYLSYVARFRESIEPALSRASVSAAEDQVRVDSLKRYGELLAQYPWLVDFLAIEAGLPPRAQPAGAAGSP